MSQSQNLDIPLWMPFVAAVGVAALVVCVARIARSCQTGQSICPSFNLNRPRRYGAGLFPEGADGYYVEMADTWGLGVRVERRSPTDPFLTV
ncbi:MAG: hypothetical protein P1U34_08330 [Coxiellaceae bacterium]|nr:hypothetical protein [Coxiellaceae bacterium]